MNRQRLTRWAARLTFSAAALAWMAFIFRVSSLSSEEVDQSLVALVWLGELRSVLGHLVMYAILASLLQLSVWSWQPFKGSFSNGSLSTSLGASIKVAIAAVVLAVIYGISDEYHQSMVPGRGPSILDVLVDGIGALTGVMAVKYSAANFLHWSRLAGRPFSAFRHNE